MKNLIFLIICLVVLTISAPLTPLMAQLQPDRTYWVQDGDTLWKLGHGDYDRLLDLNPEVEKKGWVERRTADDVYVKLPIGYTLYGVIAHESGALEVTGESGDNVLVMAPPTEVATEVLPPGVPALKPLSLEILEAPPEAGTSDFPWWVLWTLAAIGVAIMAWRNRRFFQDPVTSGEPIVAGGISPEADDAPERLSEFFQNSADRHYLAHVPGSEPGDERPVRVGPIEYGFAHGAGNVEYRGFRPGQPTRTEARNLRNRSAYRALFRNPDGSTQERTALQDCMNEIYELNAWYIGFRFTKEREIEEPAPVQEPSPIHAQVEQPPQPTTEALIALGKGGVKLDLKADGPTANIGKDPVVTLIVNGGTMRISEGAVIDIEEAVSATVTPAEDDRTISFPAGEGASSEEEDANQATRSEASA